MKAIANLKTDQKLYIIRDRGTGLFKIGIAKDPQKRLKQLQTGNGSKLEIFHIIYCEKYPASYLEKRMHRWFPRKSCYGEWRSLTQEDLEWLLSTKSDRIFW